MISIVSCDNTNRKIQGSWVWAGAIYDNEEMHHPDATDDDIYLYFGKDTVIEFCYTPFPDTLILKGDKILFLDSLKRPTTLVLYEIETLTDENLTLYKIGINGQRDHKEVFKRVKTYNDYIAEKQLSPEKYSDNILGEWKIFQEKNNYSGGEWELYGEKGWHIIFSKDKKGHKINGDHADSFDWTMPENGNILIITKANATNDAIRIKSMTNHTMHLIIEDEEMRLVRVD